MALQARLTALQDEITSLNSRKEIESLKNSLESTTSRLNSLQEEHDKQLAFDKEIVKGLQNDARIKLAGFLLTDQRRFRVANRSRECPPAHKADRVGGENLVRHSHLHSSSTMFRTQHVT
eukprot:766527-Hanusia_phi.AAC.8